MEKSFCFTVDDNIRFLKEITENTYISIFEHPYLSLYRRLHEKYGLKVQLNLFYRADGFNLFQMSDAYCSEWENNADWLKLSFHSDVENIKPYEFSGYDEVYRDCKAVNDRIIHFASLKNLAKTTTVHYCLATAEGLKAIADNKVIGLLGLFGDETHPRTSYGIEEMDAARIRNGAIVTKGTIAFAAIDIVMNSFSRDEILAKLKALSDRDAIRLMIHEQYFYPDYPAYQPDFEEKLNAAFSYLKSLGYKIRFFEEQI